VAEVAADAELRAALATLPEPGLAASGGGLGRKDGGSRGIGAMRLDLIAGEPIPTVDQLLGNGDPPQLLNKSRFARLLAAHYPRRLLARGVGGEVVLRFVISREGRIEPRSVMVLSYREEEFALVTLKFLPQLRFRPGHLSGRAVRVSVEMPIRFLSIDS
jgi:TonB family protein